MPKIARMSCNVHSLKMQNFIEIQKRGFQTMENAFIREWQSIPNKESLPKH